MEVEDLKFLLAQITLKCSKKWRETAAAPPVLPDEPTLNIRPWARERQRSICFKY